MINKLKKNNKIIITLLLSAFVLMSIINYSDAASFSITSGISEIIVGKTYNIKITAVGLTGKFNITHSDNVSVNVSSIWVENGAVDGTITVTAKSEGKATVTVTPDAEFGVSDANGLVSLSAKTDTVTVTPNTTSSGGGNGSSSDEKPKFTSVNQTVYCTEDDVNVRSSYSTSSAALGQLDKGDSVTRTGTATVNGRNWSKITYNGKTAYVVSAYLSTTKPVIEENNEEEEENTTEKSSNNLLKSLNVIPEGLVPVFDQNIAEYELTIGSDIDTVKVDAIAEDEKAKVTVSGNKDLELGKNTITIKVTAEDKSERTYKIVVTKEKEAQLGLKELLIEGLPLNPEFSETIYEYTLDLDKEVSELNITATSSREDAEVEIVGNTKLQPGENLITVLVTDEDEVVTYQIKVNVPVPVVEENNFNISDILNNRLYLYIAIGIIVVILIVLIIFLLKRKNDDDEDEYGNNDIFEQDKPEEDNSQTQIDTSAEMEKLSDDELPKSLRKSKEENESEMSEDRKKKIDELTSNSVEYEEALSRRKKGKHF